MTIETVPQLEGALSEPSAGAIDAMRRLDGDVILLGVGGKMGPTLARMTRRASDAAKVRRRIIGVSRFSSGGLELSLQDHGIETIRCDLTDSDAVRGLPDAPNVIFMTGMKFGASANPGAAWVMNTCVPGVVCERYRGSRILAFSTGNVYGLATVDGPGSKENDTLRPVGEYAMSCVGRERVFEYFSRKFDIPLVVLRLNYACELRYGVLVDLARAVASGELVDLSMGHFNVIWQADANAMALCAIARASSPPWVVNVTGPEKLSVRQVCERIGAQIGRAPRFCGVESGTALLSDARQALELFGPPRVTADELIDSVAEWIIRGGETWNKPTHFQSRDGLF
jgi:nucleoside-diphosphate-sugar epimerase